VIVEKLSYLLKIALAVSLSKYVPQHYSSNRNEAAANENSSSNFLCKKKTIFVESEKLQKGMRI